MRSFVRGAALLVALTCAVWVAVLWRWRSTGHDMDAGDAVVYLCALPVVVGALALAVRWAVRGALRRADARVAATPAAASSSDGAPTAPTAPTGDDAAAAPWHLLGAWVQTAAGRSVDELRAALEAGSSRPQPDDALHDDEGLPVMTARIARLDTDAVESALQRHADAVSTSPEGQASAALPPRAVRALAILSPLVDELAQSLQSWSEQEAGGAVPSAALGGTSAAATPRGGDRRVRVLAAWPVDWDEATCTVAKDWLAERLGAALGRASPPARCSIAGQRMTGAELLSAAQRTLDDLKRQGRDDPVALIACHSDLDDTGIRALDVAQRLFHPTRRPKVSMAGEGAAVLLVSATRWPLATAIDWERVHLAGPTLFRRSRSIEAAGRHPADDTVGLVRLGLARAGVAGEVIAKLASDADQHTARTAELFAVTLALMPDLDANDDLCLAGAVAGRLEAVAPLLTLACAAAQAREAGRPALALSLADPHWRIAAVLVPDAFATAPA